MSGLMNERPEQAREATEKEQRLYCALAMEMGHTLVCKSFGGKYDCFHCPQLLTLKKEKGTGG